MEPRGAICEYDAKDDRSTLWVSSQGVSMIRPVVADMILKIGSPKLRVRTGDVGGGFGMKIFVHPEYPMIVWASRLLKRTVKWIPDRQEAFQSDVQGRDHVSIAEMALDKDCHFIGCRITTYAALGAYLSHFSAFIPTLAGSSMLVGLYQTPATYVNVKGVLTNTVPTDAYRGAGRPEAAYLLERFVDHIARETGLTPDEIRARNFVKPSQIPWKTALGDTYDSGDFESVMRKGMDKADWKGFPARRAASEAKGKWRGIGMATYVEKCGGGGAPETAIAKFNDDASVTLYLGNQTNGQGHETAIRQIASARLGIDAERIDIVQGDSDVTPEGFTGGSRMVSVAGVATLGVADKIIAKGKLVAASVLEASCSRHRLCRRRLQDRRHRPHDEPVRCRPGRQGPQAPAGGREARPGRRVHAHARSRHLSQRLSHLRTRGRPRHRHAGHPELQRDGRFRQRSQSAAAAGPGPWRRRPGRRARR